MEDFALKKHSATEICGRWEHTKNTLLFAEIESFSEA
jgi:hypothetical protein